MRHAFPSLWKWSTIGALALTAAVAGATFAMADGSSGDTYYACVNNSSGALKMVDESADCAHNEHKIQWNQDGPQGPAGPQGLRGDTGPQGPAGPAGSVSLQSLDGTVCRRADGSAGAVAVTVNADNSITLNCGTGADWCASQPPVGPHMTANCDGVAHTVTYACDQGWIDANNNPVDGCEQSTSGLAPISFSNQAAEYLAVGFFGLNVTNSPFPVPADCGGALKAACPGDIPSNPLPTMVADGSQHPGDFDRAQVIPDQANSELHITLRVRLKTLQPIPITLPTIGACGLSIDTTLGAVPDATVTLIDHVLPENPNGPTVVSDVALAGSLERSDYSLSGGIGCQTVTSIDSAALSSLVEHAITQWVSDVGRVCGADSPFYWQECP